MFSRPRFMLTFLLLLSICSILAAVGPIWAEVRVLSKPHESAPRAEAVQASTTTSTSTSHGRHGQGVPPGLSNAWAHSNMSVVARAVTHAIFLNGMHGVELAWIAITASSNGQMIQNVAFNETVAQIKFDHDGNTELSVNSSEKPAAVFADDFGLTEASSQIGLTPASDAWTYNQTSHVLTVFADPSSITIFYGTAPAPVPEFPAEFLEVILTLAIVATAAMIVAGQRIRR